MLLRLVGFLSRSGVPYHVTRFGQAMTFATASKISGVCLLALAAEILAAYFLFSNYVYDLAQTGGYTVQEAYATGPIAPAADVFYLLFGVTSAAALVPLAIATVSFALTPPHARNARTSDSTGATPPARPRDSP